jgi:hypothetical protein
MLKCTFGYIVNTYFNDNLLAQINKVTSLNVSVNEDYKIVNLEIPYYYLKKLLLNE